MNISGDSSSNKVRFVDIEEDIVIRCQKGDQEALKEIFDRYHRRVYRIAYGVVREREDALEIVQEVFIKLYRSIKNFKGKSNFYTYLYRIAMNTAIDHSRMKKPSYSLPKDDERNLELSNGAEKRPDHILMQKELEERVNLAMDRLPPDQKAVLIFREIEGLSYYEIAETMGCSIGTVMSRLHYGRKRLRELLKDYFESP